MKKITVFVILLFLISSHLFSESPYQKDKDDKEIKPDWDWSPGSDKKSQIGKEDSLNSETLKEKKLPKTTDFFVYGASIGSPASINFNLGYYFKDFVIRGSGGRWRPHWYGGQIDFGYTFWKTPVITHSISLVAGAFQVDPFNPEVGRGGQTSYPTGLDVPGYQNRNPTYEDILIRSYVTSVDPTAAFILEYESRDRQKVYLKQQYLGLTYDILLGNFFLQLGGGIGQGDYKNPQLLLQMGYLFDTRSNQ
ncbi:hypothetical protein EHQ58_09725 [Leptospira ognonensis]|uniref:Uncharacterized protein n=1 Tax=Leptospira ognonensis TaxID=2484945 RepID=A0A4R9K4E5_9LEPT|nr:hypothetical protein [Leptospira ognonensis]TGL59178.1 hypothetical protein EHQ58_09725 [Leptospira ognonensis]